MAEKEKAAVAVETTATNAQEASPASVLNDKVDTLIRQYVGAYKYLIALGKHIRIETDDKVKFYDDSLVCEGIEIVEAVLSDSDVKKYDVEYEEKNKVLRHIRLGEYYSDGEIYGEVKNGTETV